MTPEQALLRLQTGDQLFFRDYAERTVYARLVLAGLARCYVIKGGDEYVRLATDEERRLSAQAEKVMEEAQL